MRKSLIFQILIKPLLQCFDKGILLVNAPLNLLDVDVIGLFYILQCYRYLCEIFLLPHRWLWGPLLSKKFLCFLHRCNKDFEYRLVKNEGVLGFAVTAAQVILFQEWADCGVLNIGKEGLPVAGGTHAAI